MRLSKFIRDNRAAIIAEWEGFAKSLIAAKPEMNSLALRDHIDEMLSFIIVDIESHQTEPEQFLKSQGDKAREVPHTAAETHAALRLAGGFAIDQMVSEYRALRASVIKLWGAENATAPTDDIKDLTRFNESIDQQVAESVSHYTKQYNHLEDLFLSILSHDIRSPISAAHMCAALMLKIGTMSEQHKMLTSQIISCTVRATEIVTNLFQLMNARFGSGYPVVVAPMDMSFVARQLVEEMRTVFPNRTINLEVSGETVGKWDRARIGQVFSNLIGNALEHGFKDAPILVSIQGTEAAISISVHNEGIPILKSTQETIFNPLTHYGDNIDAGGSDVAHMGLGLFIIKEIVAAHHGTIHVISTEMAGTTFVVSLPKEQPES